MGHHPDRTNYTVVGEFKDFVIMHPHDLNDDELKAKLAPIDERIKKGTIFDAPTPELEAGLHALCAQRTGDTFTAREINKGFLLSTILMERRSRFHNWLVIGLAVIAILVGAVQVWIVLPPKALKNSGDEQHASQNQHSDSDHQQNGSPVDAPPKVIIDGIPNSTPKK